MLFSVICLDKAGCHHIRQDNRAAHLAFLAAQGTAVKAAGPFLDETAQHMVGSLLIIEADDRAHLDAILAEDPYRQAGLFESVAIRPWRWTIGRPEEQ